MNAPAIFPATSATLSEQDEALRANALIAHYEDRLQRAIAGAKDAWYREEASRCLARVRVHADRIASGAMFAANTALVWLGPNMHGPRIDAACRSVEP